jgi:hypothetical protein
MWLTAQVDLGALGYVEEEYFAEGDATAYDYAVKPPPERIGHPKGDECVIDALARLRAWEVDNDAFAESGAAIAGPIGVFGLF